MPLGALCAIMDWIFGKAGANMTKLQKLRHYTVGDRAFYRYVLTILAPLVVQNTVTNVVNLVDNVMIGAVGTLPMSAVAIVNQLLFIFNLAIWGGFSGAGIFSAQYVGAGDHAGVRYCFRSKIYMGVAFCLIAFGVFLSFPDQLISLYFAEGTPKADALETLQHGKDYLYVMLIGLPAFALSQAYGGTLREMGETKLPMIASVVAILVNLVFNYILIFGNQGLPFLPFGPMGVKGAAIATVMSRFVEAAVIVAYVHAKKEKYAFIKGAYKSVYIPKALTTNIVKKGTPLLVNEILWGTGMALIMQCYSQRGLEVVAATNITNTVSNLFNVIFLSMGNAIAIIIGHMLGANETEKAKVTVWRLLAFGVAACVVMGGILAGLSPFIPYVYKTSQQVRMMATELLLVVAVLMPVFSFSFGCYFALRSGGKTMITFAFDGGYTWLLAFPVAYILAYHTSMPIVPLFLCVQLLDTVKSIVGFILIKKGVWINNIVKEES